LLSLVALIGLITVYKNFKGKQLCLQLKNEQFINREIANQLDEYSGLEGRAIFYYCAKSGVSEMISEPFPY